MNINLTLFMQAVASPSFIWFTAKFVWPPLMRAIETRQKQIADGLAAGEQGRQSLASAEKRIAEMMAEAKAQLAEIIAQGEKLKTETIEEAKVEAKAEARAHRRRGQGRDRAGSRAREGAAARPGRRSRRRRRGEDPEARSRRQGARRAARAIRQRALGEAPMAELTTIARPYAEAAFAARARRERAAGVVGDAAASRARSSPTPRVARGARQPEARRAATRSRCCCRSAATGSTRAAATSSACWSRPIASRCCRRSRTLFEALKNDADGVAKATIDTAFPLDRRAAGGAQGGAREALRQEDRGDGQRRSRS